MGPLSSVSYTALQVNFATSCTSESCFWPFMKWVILKEVFSTLKHSKHFPRSRIYSRKSRFSWPSLSSYDILRKDVIIFVALRWTASSFATSFEWWGDQTRTAYSRLGLTKLIHSGRIILFFLEKEVSVNKNQHSVSFIYCIFALLGKFQAWRNRDAKVFKVLYAFELTAFHLMLTFCFYFLYLFVKCRICWH